MRILVTGAAGFIGSHTVDLLLSEGCSVLGIDNFRTGREANIQAARTSPRFEFVCQDITADGALEQLARDFRPDAIVHLAALVSVPESIANPAENFRLNFHATQLVAASSLAGNTKRIVFASSAAVYGSNDKLPLTEEAECQPLSPYGEAKLQSEHYLLQFAAAHELTVRCQRYFNVFGPRQDPSSVYSGVISRFCAALAQDQPPVIYGDGEQTRDFVYVGDVAQANVLAACTPNVSTGVANICTGCAVSLNHLFAEISLVTGKSYKPIYGLARAGDIRHSCGSPTRAERELGVKTKASLQSGLRALVQG